MNKIKVGHYPPQPAEASGIQWAHYVEPADKAWILFVGTKGETQLYNRRKPDGAVVDDALCLPALAVAQAMRGRCQGAIGVAESRWITEFGGLDRGDGHELARRLRGALHDIADDDLVVSCYRQLVKDSEL